MKGDEWDRRFFDIACCANCLNYQSIDLFYGWCKRLVREVDSDGGCELFEPIDQVKEKFEAILKEL